VSDLSHVIEQEIALLDGFVRLLKEEQAQLVAGNSDALPTLAQQKSRLAEQLVRSKETRSGLSGGKPLAPQDATRLGNLRQRAEEASHLNALNGKLIGERLSHNQAALKILMDATRQATVYGPDGQTQVGGSGRPLGSA
jgi:flagella synthesis protein FlgN